MKRETAIDTIKELPKNFKVEDLFEKLLFIEKVEKGLEQVEAGKTHSHASVVKHFQKKWSK